MPDLALPAASESCRTSLTSVPSELLTLIALNLAPRDAASFARVARAFTLPSEPALWRELNLALPDHFGKLPMPSGYDPQAKQYAEWQRAEAMKAEDRHRQGIKEKVATVLALGDEKKRSYVKAVRLIPRPEAVAGMVQLLDRVTGSLRRLELESPCREEADAVGCDLCLATHESETLDHAFLEYPLSFPELEHLRIAAGALFYEEVIPLVCYWSRKLRSLEVESDPPADRPDWGTVPSARPIKAVFGSDTPIQILRLTIYEQFLDRTGGVSVHDYGPSRLMLSLLEHCPQLRQLDLRFMQGSYGLDSAYHRLITIFAKLDDLRDLCWRIEFPSGMEVGTGHRRGVPAGQGSIAVERLVFLDAVEWVDIFVNLPELPNLQTLIIASKTGEPPTRPLSDDLPTYTLPLEENIANQIRRCPKLVTMHHVGGFVEEAETNIFSQIDRYNLPGGLAGRVSSLCHGDDDEIIHVYAYLPKLPRFLEQAEGPGEDAPGRWEYLTDWRGYTVPIEVISRMRRISGIKDDAEWFRRGVEVGPRAWEVLRNWHQSLDSGMGARLGY